ncbi:pulmonary surfactant-associated protein D-like [Tubulanus polymorphus]|uniref:pulmonary surfactant-associated protein D-like n=1 Tax=Tubulanus polymorphus TaxID=672921 RepID=UPI003DA6174A
MKLMISTLFLICSTTAVSACVCEAGWTKAGNTKCFIFSSGSLSQHQHCSSSRLAMVESVEENNVAQSLIPSSVHSAYLGFTDPDQMGFSKFTFPSGYHNWANNEPSDVGGDPPDKEPCLEIYQTSGKWNDVNCWDYKPAICSKNCQ